MFARATTFFGGVAVVLSSIGLFGLMSYSVSRRTNEIGIRMALGARRADVVQLVMRQTFMLVFAGVIVGFAGSLAITRVIETMPFLFPCRCEGSADIHFSDPDDDCGGLPCRLPAR
jgi:ABC-type antimicrobial peptide transport system permease subunit